MGKLDGKVALISGGARGQGRSHAHVLAEEGADIAIFDICRPIPTVPYELARPEDLEQTAEEVRRLGRRAVALEADARETEEVEQVVKRCIEELGRVDIVVANAGIISFAPATRVRDDEWEQTLAVNLTGPFKLARAAVPWMIEHGEGGSLIFISSTAGLKGYENLIAYNASKHGVVGVMRTLALELAAYQIRANSIHPAGTDTNMMNNQAMYTLFSGGNPQATREDATSALLELNLLPVAWVEPRDVSQAVLWLASDDSRYVTGAMIPVDAGLLTK